MGYQQLSIEDRATIAAFRKAGFTVYDIAKEINRSPSTIYRELKRNTGKCGYRSKQANVLSESRKHQKNLGRKKIRGKLKIQIDKHLSNKWSPEQISNRLKTKKQASLCTETIYQYIYCDMAHGGQLINYLRCKRKNRKRYGSTRKKRGKIPNRRGIEKRPLHVEGRNTYGHWEADTMVGQGKKSFLLTLVERKSRFLHTLKLENKTAEITAEAIIKCLRNEKIKSITFDNGLEFAQHEKIEKKLGGKMYFADPYSSWQRGTNENTNGLLRQYLPKGTNFKVVTKKFINRIKNELNNRPRKCLDYLTPNEVRALNNRT